MHAIRFEFDVLVGGDRSAASDAFAAINPDWKCCWGKNGGFLAEPPQLGECMDAAGFAARHVEAYAAQLSTLRGFGHCHSIRIAAYVDLDAVDDFNLRLKPSTMALAASLGYEIDFCLYQQVG
ncbi:hypothetical protein QO002_002685 [Pararhizobium capsulatum DSM 1112]|uniref:DUF4279 domain-containing protein n=1 Tax=Pararhizobium capsulatum DSM 1112 TaxID=1121113 RepID=A0ABU0BQM2_9HYPH|nr:hypothetical protein [Pararhizobium capsulatum]MDQ0320547.1 hypothetical protein [Pararhizobium capsulatum DSM 1112]